MTLSALVLALTAGLATSIGPCIAPRYVALVAMTAGRALQSRMLLFSVFVSGTVLGDILLGHAAALLIRVLAASAYVYLAMGTVLLGAGIAQLVRAGAHHQCDSHRETPMGGVFLLGLTSAFVISPCCAPLVSGLGMLYAGMGPLETTSIILGFAVGHLAPLALAAWSSGWLVRFPRAVSQAARVVSAGLMLALGGYYMVLA